MYQDQVNLYNIEPTIQTESKTLIADFEYRNYFGHLKKESQNYLTNTSTSRWENTEDLWGKKIAHTQADEPILPGSREYQIFETFWLRPLTP